MEKLNLATDSGLAEARRHIETGDNPSVFAFLNAVKSQRGSTRNVDFLRALYFLKRREPVSAIEALKEELRYFPDNEPAAKLLAKLVSQRHTKPSINDREFLEILEVIRPYTMVGEARLYSLFNLAKQVCLNDVSGNFVECGVAAGGSSALLAKVIARFSRQSRRLFAFDTFEGMPAATVEDTSYGKPAEATGWGAGTCSAPEASLREACQKLGVENLVEPVTGLFAETLPINRERIGAIAFLHMDGDWYSSTLDIMENLFDQVVPGGLIQIDDYGYWEGCKRAVSEFEQKRGLKFQLTRIDETGVWLSR